MIEITYNNGRKLEVPVGTAYLAMAEKVQPEYAHRIVLVKVRGKCQQLLLRMYEEKSEIMMMNDTDRRWVQLIVYFVKEVLLKEQVRAR